MGPGVSPPPWPPKTFPVIPLIVIRESLIVNRKDLALAPGFTSHDSRFTGLAFTVYRLPFTVYRLRFLSHVLRFTGLAFTVYRLPFTVYAFDLTSHDSRRYG